MHLYDRCQVQWREGQDKSDTGGGGRESESARHERGMESARGHVPFRQ